ncbi:RICIN domain-containing protein [uncultured Clostridium sp.]|uniref:RICIN domain-containing protein n=1 Tax=uncultured Clostridium sp. TaxID=59620 RepID=UPI0028E19651|nr:RICIN domain-containing protein [uncultured Clostridium sp.]
MNKKILSKISLSLSVAALLSIAPISSIHASSAAITSGKTYKLININSNKALDVYAAQTANYSNVDIYSDNDTGAQKWKIVTNSDGTYKLINTASNRALDVYAAKTDDYTNVDIYDDNGSNAQKWRINQNSDGSYKLINVGSNKALDVYAAKIDDYTNVDIFSDNGTAAQKWNIVQVDDTSGGNTGTGQVYTNQDVTAYTSPVGGITSSGVPPTPYQTCAVHPADRSNPLSAPVFPFGSIITTSTPLNLPGYGNKSTFVVQDKGDLAFQKSQYWVDIFFDYENNPNAVPNAINFGTKKISYTVTK